MKKSPHIFAAVMAMCGTAPIKSDFIALNTLQQPGTGNTVYVLYDAHSSYQPDNEFFASLNETIEKIKHQLTISLHNVVARVFYPAGNNDPKGREMQEFYADQDRLIAETKTALNTAYLKIDAVSDNMYNNLPNLIQQQNDLISIVKTCNISLINEDWPNRHKDIQPTQKEMNMLMRYVHKNLGEKEPENKSRFGVSPMFGLSAKLIGKETYTTIESIPNTKAYFFNPDNRKTLSFHSITMNRIDDSILKSINTLFGSPYNQKKIIVAAGYAHCIPIVNALKKYGYIESLQISKELETAKLKDPAINALLTDFGRGTDTLRDTPANTTLYPLDLMAAFAPELAQCRKSAEEFSDAIRQGNIDHVRKQLLTIAITPAMIDMARKATEENDAMMKKYDDIITLLR